MSEAETNPSGAQKEAKSETSVETIRAKNKANFQYPDKVEDRGYELGLTRTYAYHCKRCNYLWFPKDFDADNQISNRGEGIFFVGQNIFYLEPPKACARCKSRYWREDPKRITSNVLPTRLPDEYFIGFHKLNGIPRARALHRQGKLGFVLKYCRCKHCRALKNREKN